MAKKAAEQELAKPNVIVSDCLVEELRELIQQTRSSVAQTVNSALVQMYWQIGIGSASKSSTTSVPTMGKKLS